MTFDMQVIISFYLFMLCAVASNKEQSVKSFKSQFMMVGMSCIGYVIFLLVQMVSGFIGK